MRLSVFTIAAILLLSAPSTFADCGWDLLGTCKAAEKAGADLKEATRIHKEIAEILSKGGIESSRLLAGSINQFGQLAEAYHDADSPHHKRAVATIRSMFPGLDLEDQNFEFGVSVAFENTDPENPINVDMMFSNDISRETWLPKLKEELSTGDFSTMINAPSTRIRNPGQLRVIIDQKLQRAFYGHHTIFPEISERQNELNVSCPNPYYRGRPDEPTPQENVDYLNCTHRVTRLGITDAIMAAMVKPDLMLLANNTVTRTWNGGLYAVLFAPEDQILKNASMRAEATMHKGDNINEPINDFDKSAQRVDIKSWLNNESLILTVGGEERRYKYVVVSLRLTNYLGTI